MKATKRRSDEATEGATAAARPCWCLPLWLPSSLRRLVALSLLALGGCAGTAEVGDGWDATALQAVSMLGEPLYPMELSEAVLVEREAALADAVATYERDPEREENIIWLGRRQAYLGRYDLAIETFSRGLGLHPDSYRLYRHRGHRYITVRKFDQARRDLERAAALSAGCVDQVEPDGLPNARNEPRSTDKTNIEYHLGLASYLLGSYDQALRAWQNCLDHSTNDDMTVASLYWIELCMLRLGETDAATALLESVTDDMDVIENHAYHQLLLLYKGRRQPAELQPSGDGDQIQSSTTAYGLANWYRMQGDRKQVTAMLERIVADPAWPAFGHIAAETDLARARTRHEAYR